MKWFMNDEHPSVRVQSLDERFAHDLYYVEHRSMRLDLRILQRTVVQVLSGAGVSHPDEATMARVSLELGSRGTAQYETLAAIPSVIVGFWALYVLAPFLLTDVDPALAPPQQLECAVEAIDIAMQVGDDAELQRVL